MRILFTLMIFLGFFTSAMFAQRTVTGTVLDPAGEPLIGANVLVQGTDLGTITEIDGSFSLGVPAGSSILIFSYTGFETQEVDVSTRNQIDITLNEGELLDEIVVTME